MSLGNPPGSGDGERAEERGWGGGLFFKAAVEQDWLGEPRRSRIQMQDLRERGAAEEQPERVKCSAAFNK